MASPLKKPGAKKSDDALPDVGPSTIIDVFKAVYGPEKANNEVVEEFFNLMMHDRLRLEAEKDIIAERRSRRLERREAKRRQEEERRMWERRNNPENLSICAAQIQKIWRMIPVRRAYQRLRAAMGERRKKRAVVIILDHYEDARIRPPVQLVRSAFDMVRMLQACNFAVDIYSSVSRDPLLLPSKANIAAALASAAAEASDTLVWVHVCAVGATGTVHGRNPHKEAELEKQKLLTPRTRLLHALQSSHRSAAPGAGAGAGAGGAAAGDVRRYIMPCDARSGRATFDAVISLEELLDVLHARHGEVIHGRSLAQRIVTVDAAELGAVEGQQGGGFAVLASTATGEAIFEMPRATGHQLMEPCRGALSWGLLQCLLGEAWTQQQLSTGSVASFLTIEHVAEYVERLFDAQGVACVRRGRRWGDIVILRGERGAAAHSFFHKAVGRSGAGLPGSVAGPTAGLSDDAGAVRNASMTGGTPFQEKSRGRLRRRRGPEQRTALSHITIRVDLAKESTRINVFDPEFTLVLGPFLSALAQVDHSLPPHRQAKVVVHRLLPTAALTIGVSGTFLDVAARCKTRGGEAAMWSELTAKLVSGQTPPPHVECCVGRAEEGGVAVRTFVSSWANVQSVLGQLSVVPEILGGVEHRAVFIDVTAEVTCTAASLDQLDLIARGITPVARGGADPLVKTARSDATSPTSPGIDTPSNSALAHSEQALLDDNRSGVFTSEDLGGSIAATPADGVVPPVLRTGRYVAVQSDLDAAALEQLLDTALGSSNIRNRNWFTAFAKQRVLRLLDASEIVQRLNDLDDQGMDALMRRERPAGSPLPYTHTGLVVVVVAFVGTMELRLRQASELHLVAQQLEVVGGFRFLLWEVNEVLKNDARDHFPRERMSKLLDAIKFNLGPSALPAVLVLDLFKKRYYRMRQPVPSAVYDAKTIAHFCEEFLRGTLGELLPPVKGCRVFGGGAAAAKYALIPV